MKYFNHMTSSVEDEKHEALIDRAGLAGYGAYWIVLEKVASQIRPEQVSTSLALTWRNWGRHLRVTTKTAQFLLRCMSDAGLISLSQVGDIVRVNVPNLLKYADEYSKKVGIKSRQTPEKVPSESGSPALPALPEHKDLGASAPAGGFEAPAVAPEPVLSASPSSEPYQGKDKCQEPGCTRRGRVKDTLGDGKWKCSRHGPDRIDDPDPPPPPGNGAGKGENKTSIPQIIRALNLTPEKSEAVAPLFHRHQERPFPNDELASQLLSAGLDAGEVFRTAQVFFLKQ